MSFAINTNIASLQAQNYLRVNQESQSKTINRVTSGLRIIQSGDDAAGLAIANGFRSDEAVLTQGIRNANDGLSQLQIADGGASNISQLLDRARTLATQSASGTFSGDRSALNSEFQSVLGEVNRQAQSIGLDTNGVFAKSLSVFVGGGKTNNGVNSITNGSVTVDLSKSSVDARSLGLQGVQSAGIAGTDIGSGSATTSVASILADATNTGSEKNSGFTEFFIQGPGFSDSSKIRVAVNLAGVSDTGTLATAVNSALTAAGNAGSQAGTAFKNANITASVNTDSQGRQQLTFNSSSAAFQVQAGDRVANSLLGNFETSSVIGRDVTNTVNTGGTVTTAGSLTQNTIIRIQGAGLAAPVDLSIASGTTTVNALTSLTSLVANNSALQAAGITVGGTGAVGSAITFSNARGEQFNVSDAGDTANLLGLGTFANSAANGNSFDYSSITGTGATFAAGQTLEFSVGGGAKVSVAVGAPSAATVAAGVTALNAAFSGNAALQAAGLVATNNAGQIQIAATNGSQFRVNALGGANIFGFGSGGTASTSQIASVSSTPADNTNVHFDSAGASQTATFQFNAIVNGQDAQTLNLAARDGNGVEHSLAVVLQNNSTVKNARSVDEAVHSINTALQQSNDATLKQVVAVKEYIDNTHEGIKFVSTLPGFNVGIGAAGTGGAVGVGAAADQGKITTAAAVGTGGLSDISNQNSAQSAVTALANSVAVLGLAQAAIGKGENQFSYAVNLASSQLTNISAAESRIRDADLAAESANLTKSQVLLQAGIAALAQANSAPQQVLALLRG